ncbi:condensation domain-containing protein [Actinoplanes oblitus]|uniref:Condensation domain-containing protein n=1 Tax=Actinoplanes oblitus TaxID=3040509 RepID=A0ABY8WBX5_9ACTN|nr:condensation domain-containing protein [Actinoplanes oblitus]WIM94415.1 condensation domain-containing protein [Actinoplanes oblitus]
MRHRVTRRPRDGHLPLSCSQERLWFILRLHPDIRAYQFQATIALTGKLDTGALREALTEVVRRHEIFRTTFADSRDGPRQIVHPPFPVDLPLDDVSEQPDSERAARRALDEAVDVDIPVDRLPLIRWRLVRLADDRHVLLHLEHHLIHDGWGFNVFLAELSELYRAYASGQPSPLSEPELQFADFAAWQQDWVRGPSAQRQLDYWRRRLDGVPHLVDLPTDHPRTPARRFAGAAPRFVVRAELADRLRELARRERVSLFVVMLAAYAVLLRDWSGKEDFCVASGVAARHAPETERMLGMIVNTVALRTDLRADPAFPELLRRVRDTTFGALEHQDVPFDQVVAALRPRRQPGRQLLSDVAFSFHDSPLRTVEMPDLRAEVTVGMSNHTAKFDLSVIAIPEAEQAAGQPGRAVPGEVELIWEYDTDLFDAATIARMADRYDRLLTAVVADPQARLSTLIERAS